ncbi:O-antigen ligase family protein [Paenibacillus sp. S150]|uniref:O-antigen ligase family protein n=1 Tax=Paenibacillus sp. S150 TaxID=2749826 RepID=UPI001C58C8B0|nr:O-antigen ligase family protein [Paenibacillus sp. S150]MBW4083775.1 O-antigen ligase family protein [Paenibacillus sp. S150]
MRLKKLKKGWGLAVVYACAGAVIAAAMAACLLRGLFFAGEMYPFLAVWFVLCCVLAVCVLAAAPGLPESGVQGDLVKRLGMKNAQLLLLCCPLAVLVLYAAAGLRGPVSSQETLNELLRWGFYASFAILACFCAGHRQGARLLAAAWHLAGMAISLSALLAATGVLDLPYAVAYSSAPEVSATGARLAGLLQYPNSFGAVMAVFLLERLFAVAAGMEQAQPGAEAWKQTGNAGAPGLSAGCREWSGRDGIRERNGKDGIRECGIKERSGKVGIKEGGGRYRIKNWGRMCRRAAGKQHRLLRMLPLFPCAAALLLSESRGAWLAAALACAAVLPWRRQLCAPLLLAGAAPVAAAALLCRQLARAGLAAEPVSGLLLLAGLWGAALLGGAWLCRRRPGAAGGGRAARVVLAAAVWTAAGGAVLLQVRGRITGPSSTVAARGLLYRDAWKLAAEAPWLGRGGGTWRSTYLAAQSRPYVGSQVHSGYLDLLLNLGGVGLAVILLLLAAAGWLAAAAAPRLLPPLLALALHSAVDFDWSYGLIWLLLFLLPALALAEKLHCPAADNSPKPPAAASAGFSACFSACFPASAEPPPGTGAPGGSRTSAATIPASAAGGFLVSPASAATARASGSPAQLSGSPAALPAAGESLGSAAGTGLAIPAALSPPLAPVPVQPRRGKFFALLRPLGRTAGVALLCGVALTLASLSFHAMKGESLYKQAAAAPQSEAAISLLRQSLRWNPREPRAAAALSRLLPDRQGSALLLQSLDYSPENAELHWELAKRAMGGNDPGTALYRVRRAERLDVFNADKRIEAAEGMLDMSVRRLRAGDGKGACQSADAGLELLREYRLLAEQEGSKGMQHNDRRFGALQEAEGIYLRLMTAHAEASRSGVEAFPVNGGVAAPGT